MYNIKSMFFFFFFHRLEWFPIQGLRPTCYCIPRRIPAVGVIRHTPCAHCRTWVYPYQGDASHHTTMDPASLSSPAPHAHGARPLDVNLRVVRFPAPRINVLIVILILLFINKFVSLFQNNATGFVRRPLKFISEIEKKLHAEI